VTVEKEESMSAERLTMQKARDRKRRPTSGSLVTSNDSARSV